MDESAGSSDREMQTIQQSLSYKLNSLKQTWVGTQQALVDRGDFGKLIDFFTKISEGIGSATGELGLFKTALLGITAVLSAKNNVGEWNYISKFRSNNIVCCLNVPTVQF